MINNKTLKLQKYTKCKNSTNSAYLNKQINKQETFLTFI